MTMFWIRTMGETFVVCLVFSNISVNWAGTWYEYSELMISSNVYCLCYNHPLNWNYQLVFLDPETVHNYPISSDMGTNKSDLYLVIYQSFYLPPIILLGYPIWDPHPLYGRFWNSNQYQVVQSFQIQTTIRKLMFQIQTK